MVDHTAQSPAGSDGECSTLVEQLVETIQERISRGTYSFGTWIRQEPLARELGVSRMPVRKALARLEAQGVVELVPNRGARPKSPSMRELLEAFEVRAVLEGHAACQAASSITHAQLSEMFTAVASFRAVAAQALSSEVDPSDLRDRWVQANNAFHDAVLDACGNSQLRATVASLHQRIPRNLTWTALDGDPRLLEENANAHAVIAEAIDGRDGERARELMIEHSRRARELIVKRSYHQFAP